MYHAYGRTYVTCHCKSLPFDGQQIDDSASESFLGLIVAGYSLGSLVAAPLFGLWSNYRPVSEPIVISLIIYSGGNLLYVYAENFSDKEKWILFISRLTVGVGSGIDISWFSQNYVQHVHILQQTLLSCVHIAQRLLRRMNVIL